MRDFQEIKYWYEDVSEAILNGLETFYLSFYPGAEIINVGKDKRVNPCPFCRHNDCFTITEGKNAAYCFSCGTRGTHIQLLKEYLGEEKAIAELARYTGIEYFTKELTKEQKQKIEEAQRYLRMKEIAVEFYHQQLLNEPDAIIYQLSERGHEKESLSLFKIGISKNYPELRERLLKDFDKEEIKKVWFPCGKEKKEYMFVYPYISPFTGEILRMNSKNPFGVKIGGAIVSGLSTRGDGKPLMYIPGVRIHKKKAVIVEGENDLITVYERNKDFPYTMVAVGGNIGPDQLSQLQQFEELYCFFDNDNAGADDVFLINERFPEKPVYKIKYDSSYKDPDDYYRKCPKAIPLVSLINNAEALESDGYKTIRNGDNWILANRKFRLEFNLKEYNYKKGYIGDIKWFKNGVLDDGNINTSLVQFKKARPYHIHLMAEMNKYYNEDLGNKDPYSLISIYQYSNQKTRLQQLLAKHLVDKRDEKLQKEIEQKLDGKIANAIFQESVRLSNASVNNRTDYPVMPIGQYFHLKNDDVYFYFASREQAHDGIKLVPCLVSNKKNVIRLDALRRPDPQYLLLVEGKYQLPTETLIHNGNTSLNSRWVEKFLNDEYDAEEVAPMTIVSDIERLCRKFYYTPNDCEYSLIALYVYSTYYYNLLKSVAYLLLNGNKGTGKSTLGLFLKNFCYNATSAVDVSEAALYREIGYYCRTYIIDEAEDLNESKYKYVNQNPYTKILRGGYSTANSNVKRWSTERNCVEEFNIFAPKVICNISGVDIVTADRCIELNTYEAPREQTAKLEDIKWYESNFQEEISDVTSRCCISALIHYKDLANIYYKEELDTTNARLRQIMKPLAAIAKLVGGKYYGELIDYFNSKIAVKKKEIEENTSDGILINLLGDIALEIVKYRDPDWDKEFLRINNDSRYGKSIEFDIDEGWFKLDSVHLKVFYEKVNPETIMPIAEIHKVIKRCDPRASEAKKRVWASLSDLKLTEEFRSRRPKVYEYKFYIEDYVENVRPLVAKEEIITGNSSIDDQALRETLF